MTIVDIDLEDEDAMQLWVAVGHLASQLPGQWTLVGGLMVQLHALEHGITDVRPTRDIDILGQSRPQDALRSIDVALRGMGFEPLLPDLDGYAHRYERDGVIVDLLAPDGINPPPDLGAGRRAIGIPAARRPSFALRRSPQPWTDTSSSFAVPHCSERSSSRRGP